MNKPVKFSAIIGLIAFTIFFPLGLTFAAFLWFWALLLGLWSWNSGLCKLPWFAVFGFAIGFGMGLIGVISACVGFAPGAGTLVYGSGSQSFVLTLPSYGAGREEFSFGLLPLMFLPSAVGAWLARWLHKRIREAEGIQGVPSTPA